MLACIEAIYDASTDINKWQVALARITELLSSKGGQIAYIAPATREISFVMAYNFDLSYQRRYEELTPSDPRGKMRRPWQAITCRDTVSTEELRASPIYREILGPLDIEYSLWLEMPIEDGTYCVLSIGRGRADPPFDDQDKETISHLMPHVLRAVRLHVHFAQSNFQAALSDAMMDALPLGMITIDQAYRLHAANHQGRLLMAARDGIENLGGGLWIADSGTRQTFQRLVAAAIDNVLRGGVAPPGALTVPRHNGNGPLQILISPLWSEAMRQSGLFSQPMAMLFVTDPDLPREAPFEVLQRLFALTPTEARVLQHLIDGASPKEVARTLAVSPETIRTHLRNLFAKTGTSRQGELISHVMASPAWLAAGRG